MSAQTALRPPLPSIAEQALNRWPGILARLGVPSAHLMGKQCPCPICGGRDRFRFDNLEGRGTWICNTCGAGDGIALVMKRRGLSFRDAVAEVRAIVGDVPQSKAGRRVDDARAHQRCRELWLRSRLITPDDDAGRYLLSRGIEPPYPECLRFCAETEVRDHPERKTLPAMLARVSGPDGAGVNIHRTYLEGGRKAVWTDAETGLEVSPRRMMPGRVPDGSAIRLAPYSGVLGVAEGIETAMRAAMRFGVPVWAAINSTMLEKFVPPADVVELHIFGDNDLKFGGQAAAYRCAHRVAVRDGAPRVVVHIPELGGTDWADGDGGFGGRG